RELSLENDRRPALLADCSCISTHTTKCAPAEESAAKMKCASRSCVRAKSAAIGFGSSNEVRFTTVVGMDDDSYNLEPGHVGGKVGNGIHDDVRHASPVHRVPQRQQPEIGDCREIDRGGCIIKCGTDQDRWAWKGNVQECTCLLSQCPNVGVKGSTEGQHSLDRAARSLLEEMIVTLSDAGEYPSKLSQSLIISPGQPAPSLEGDQAPAAEVTIFLAG
ncbi:hypothetical protein B0H14DRAFT_3716961, partial [Mycena olivaceomarginata]